MAEAESKSRDLRPTLWGLLFAAALALAAAHLVTAVLGQEQREGHVVESTFTERAR